MKAILLRAYSLCRHSFSIKHVDNVCRLIRIGVAFEALLRVLI